MDTPNQSATSPVVNPPAPTVEPIIVQPQSSIPEVVSQVVKKQPFYSQFSFWSFILLFINLIVIAYLWFVPLLFPYIIVKDQPLLNGITIEKARVTSEGYIVAQAEVKGSPPLTLAASQLLVPDVYDNLYLKLLDPENLTPVHLGQVDSNAKVFVSFYKDDNVDGEIDPESNDKVVRDIFGRKTQAFFYLTANDWPNISPGSEAEATPTPELSPTPTP